MRIVLPLLFLMACAGPPPQPNVVLIFVDDMGYADIGAFGEPGYETPHLDRLASEGARFTDFYVSQAVCSASRASLLTGMYANRIGIHGALGPGNTHGISAGERTLGELFQEQGYRTAVFGKWHLGHHPPFLPTRHGFDEFYGIPYSNDMWPFHPENPEAWGDLPTIEGEETVGLNTDQRRFTTDFTERGVAFIEQAAAEERPFLLYLAHPMPHVPLFVSEERAGLSGAGVYGDVIHEIDWSVGRILETLEELDLDEETLVIFTSDNGPWLSYGNHSGRAEPLREGKGTAWEGGVRVPFLARWPGQIPAGLEVSAPAMTIDIFPTLAELTGAEPGLFPTDGSSIWPLLSGDEQDAVQDAYFFYYRTNELHAVRSGPWKLHFPHTYRTMQGREPGLDGQPGRYDYSAEVGLELFNLREDIGETRDVAEANPEVLARLSALADSMRAELGDRLTGVVGSGVREPGRVE
ncbi:MAG: sulfatase [Rhodothermales bacterium]|nr:sulfatase [Rhodothermales bacterium]MBO6779967.1 sulfatase [Rhodothermales bacterium]